MSLLNNIFGSGGQQALLGTSEDEMYRNHINHLRAHEDEMLRQKYAAQAQNQLASQYTQNVAQNQLASQYTQNLAQSMMGAKSAIAGAALGQNITPFDPNEQEAYKIPLSQLVTLWQANYGDEWVEKPDEAFWMDALTRLNVAGKFEHAGGWYRIKEDA